MREPLRIAYSLSEIAEKLRVWMVETYGVPKDLKPEERDQWMTRYGIAYSFLHDHFPQEETKP